MLTEWKASVVRLARDDGRAGCLDERGIGGDRVRVACPVRGSAGKEIRLGRWRMAGATFGCKGVGITRGMRGD